MDVANLERADAFTTADGSTIRELSTPIIEVWPGVLTLPVVGHIDQRKARAQA